jgi:hypothetical protein
LSVAAATVGHYPAIVVMPDMCIAIWAELVERVAEPAHMNAMGIAARAIWLVTASPERFAWMEAAMVMVLVFMRMCLECWRIVAKVTGHASGLGGMEKWGM